MFSAWKYDDNTEEKDKRKYKKGIEKEKKFNNILFIENFVISEQLS